MKSLFRIFRHGLQKTATTLVRQVQAVFGEAAAWTPASYDELEAVLLQADLGVDTASRITADIRDRYQRGLIHTSQQILDVCAEDIRLALEQAATRRFSPAPEPPTVILVVGVNGTGKTTTVAKLARLFRADGRRVLLAACDTFRAAAVDQLKVWGQRLDCPVAAGAPGADAAAVAYDAAVTARRDGLDLVLVDTAGRQHTRRTLMEELGKIARTLGKACPGAPHEAWLTVDASIGTNAVAQAREFNRLVPLTGLVVTKLDGTGRGGAVVPIVRELRIPVLFAGLGEEMDDLQPFDANLFARALCGLETPDPPG
jgi:fused signal recognition particle receptor